MAVRPGLSFLAIAILSLVALMRSAVSAPDSEAFSGFLAEAKRKGTQPQKSVELNSVHYRTHWRTEAAKLEEIRTHVNKVGDLFTKINDEQCRGGFSPGSARRLPT